MTEFSEKMTTLTLRVAELKAENEKLKRALWKIEFEAKQAFAPDEPLTGQAGSEA